MLSNNMVCVLKCGLLTGLLWSFSQMLLVVLAFETGLYTAAEMQSVSGQGFILLDMLAGIWAVSLYTLARAQINSPTQAVSVTVLAWWIIHTLTMLKGGSPDLSMALAALGSVATFLAMAVSLAAGTLAFERIQNPDNPSMPVNPA